MSIVIYIVIVWYASCCWRDRQMTDRHGDGCSTVVFSHLKVIHMVQSVITLILHLQGHKHF